eukprot:1093353-Pelagomonas_calceolata.AAC.8
MKALSRAVYCTFSKDDAWLWSRICLIVRNRSCKGKELILINSRAHASRVADHVLARRSSNEWRPSCMQQHRQRDGRP